MCHFICHICFCSKTIEFSPRPSGQPEQHIWFTCSQQSCWWKCNARQFLLYYWRRGLPALVDSGAGNSVMDHSRGAHQQEKIRWVWTTTDIDISCCWFFCCLMSHFISHFLRGFKHFYFHKVFPVVKCFMIYCNIYWAVWMPLVAVDLYVVTWWLMDLTSVNRTFNNQHYSTLTDDAIFYNA